MLARTHLLLACVPWAALWWRPLVLPQAALEAVPALDAAQVSVLTAPTVISQAHLAAGEAPRPLLGLAVVALGALLPDLDHPKAWLARASLGPRGGLLGVVRPLVLPSAALHAAFGHRGFLHSAVAAVVVSMLAAALGPSLGVVGLGPAIAWGYAAHLLADALTRRGVPLLFPLPFRLRPPESLAIRTGTAAEALLLLVVCAAAGYYALG